MGFLSRLKTGLGLARRSLGVVRESPELAVFPLLGGVAGLAYVLLLGGVLFTADLLRAGPPAYVALFLSYLGTAFVATFFAAGLTYCTRQAFEGEDPTVRDGLRAAWGKRWSLLAWAVMSAVVGVLLRAAENADERLARVVAALFAVGWSILSYFVVPVIVFEDVGPTDMLRRSGETFRETWGESVGAGFGVGIVSFLLLAGSLVVAIALFVVLAPTGGAGVLLALVVAAVLVLAAWLTGATLTTVVRTALYVYATENEAPAAFAGVDFSRLNR